jgi:hypothetical protein
VSQNDQVEMKLVPVLREGVNVVKMIFYKNLRAHLGKKHPDRTPEHIGRLSGAVLNELFGCPNAAEPFKSFAEKNRAAIDRELHQVAADFEPFRIPLTDALRVQFLCDSREGVDGQAVLSRARDLGVLIVDREVPLPKTFMNQVRRLGVAFNLLAPMDIPEEPS